MFESKTFKDATNITYPETLKWFIEQEMDIGTEIIVKDKESEKIMKNAGSFPAKDSVLYIPETNTILVKVSDFTNDTYDPSSTND